MTLNADEFIRRFLIHVLLDGFQRIRYYGFLGNCHRTRKHALTPHQQQEARKWLAEGMSALFSRSSFIRVFLISSPFSLTPVAFLLCHTRTRRRWLTDPSVSHDP